MAEKLLKLREVADRLGISVGTLYNWVSAKRIDVVHLSARAVRVRESVVDRMAKERTTLAVKPG